ncbi:MAG: ABC transporter substrate-binding protein [Casimicrobiaceae bacterium]
MIRPVTHHGSRAALGTVGLWLLCTAAAVSAQSPTAAEKAGLIGKLETAAIVTDPKLIPKKFQEAPMLNVLVKAGKLPPVEQRLPSEPLVIKPLRSIGKYGGTWRRGFIGPSDTENGNRIRAADKPLFFNETATALVPNVARDWAVTPDGKKTTLYLRKGMRWSDGAPFNADDFMFWFKEMYQNKDLVPAPAQDMAVNGKPGRMIKVDNTTIAFEFDEPNYLFPWLLAGDTFVGGGPSRHQSQGRAYGLYAPAHYLKQYLPAYTPIEKLTEQARAAGFNNWVQLFQYKSDWSLNPDVPTVGAYRMLQPINGQTWLLERNPYFYEVDTEGNQLPYIDRVQMTLAENTEVLNLRAVAGEYDYQERHLDLAKLPTFLDNADRGGYKVQLDLGINGSDSAILFALSFREDPEIAKWISTPDFRRALSLGIDRNQLNEAFFLGLGTPGSVVPADGLPDNPGASWRSRWSTYDPVKANAMLDGIGLNKKDAEGYRLRTDDGKRLRVQIDVAQGLSATWAQQAEMISQQWRKIGIAADVKLLERNLSVLRARNEQVHMAMSSNTGTENIFVYPVGAMPVRADTAWMGAGYSLWYQSGGKSGVKPTEPELLKAYEYLNAGAKLTDAERAKAAQEIWKLEVEQQWAIGLVGQSPAYMGIRVVNKRLENVPARTCTSQQCRTPWGARPEQWYFK